jgi:hypothetical protein
LALAGAWDALVRALGKVPKMATERASATKREARRKWRERALEWATESDLAQPELVYHARLGVDVFECLEFKS